MAMVMEAVGEAAALSRRWFPGAAVKAECMERFSSASTWRRSEATMWRHMRRTQWRERGGSICEGGAGIGRCVAGK
jgi:hypothetical protein